MRLKNFFSLPMVLSFLVLSSVGRADSIKQFLTYCTYGTLAGALLGTASLAFSEDPSNQMKNIAKGASLGLYGGIGYGFYKLNSTPPPLVEPPDEEVTRNGVFGVQLVRVDTHLGWSAFFMKTF